MDNKNNPFNPENNNDPKMPKFNMNWLYILVIVATAMLLFTNTGSRLLSNSGASRKPHTPSSRNTCRKATPRTLWSIQVKET